MDNKIMTNEEIIETATEEIATASSDKTLIAAACIGLTAIAGVIAYKHIVKPLIAKIKDKKEQQAINGDESDKIDETICEDPEATETE